MLIHLSEAIRNKQDFEARLHHMKLKSPIEVENWSKKDDEKMKKFAEKRFKEFEAQSEAKKEVP